MPFDGANLTELQQALIKARGLIEEGWIKEHFQVGDKYCVMGAIEAVTRTTHLSFPIDTPLTCQAANLFMQVMCRRDYYGSITAWNDAKSRRKPQVLATFDRAIAKAPEYERQLSELAEGK